MIFILIKTPVCELYLAYYATFFAVGTRVNSASKIFEDDLKIKSEQQLYGRKRRVFPTFQGKKQNRDDALR